ncbi:MAG: hypothetical protein IPH31_23335 [Lewinellaceae bacterium]|nr:hypothetical protein [Lewinellaceae bacterium]
MNTANGCTDTDMAFVSQDFSIPSVTIPLCRRFANCRSDPYGKCQPSLSNTLGATT